MRNWGITSDRRTPRGQSTPPVATHGSYAPRDSIFPGHPTLERGNLAQAAIDVLTLFVWLVLGGLAVLIVGGPVLAVGWMLFCS
jgi:hypothetical protein